MTLDNETPTTTEPTETEPTPINPRRRGPRRGPRKPRQVQVKGGITAGLRSQLAEQVKACPCCGSTTGNKTQMAAQMGLSVMSLNKFLKGGEVRSSTIDAIYNYLNKS
jgi:hypothetical protein